MTKVIATALAMLLVAAPASAQLAKPDGTIGTVALPPDCQGATAALSYNASAATFGCNTITGGGVPAGGIVFTAGACPSGFSEYTAARGFAIVGLPASGTAAGTVGTALTDLQDKSVTPTFTGAALAGHNHTYTEVVNHKHPYCSQTATTGSISSYEHGAIDTSSAATECSITTNDPTGGVATGTTTAVSGGTPTGTVSAVTTSGVLSYIQLRACQKD